MHPKDQPGEECDPEGSPDPKRPADICSSEREEKRNQRDERDGAKIERWERKERKGTAE